ncbi:hypothetical protein ABT160_21815 [Streptomyces sp. NPDC001941]
MPWGLFTPGAPSVLFTTDPVTTFFTTVVPPPLPYSLFWMFWVL